MTTPQIPKGYVLVPESTYNLFIKKIEWQDIEIPTIKDVAEYVGVSIEKIKKDLRHYDCPLKVIDKGSRGKGKMKTFLKSSVAYYKEWLNKKAL
ncbi:hypothetical protein [Riemerella anatipestifer]|uniref:Uncharacterized protein n=1 Tax=Riemerella anatipestifer TaxID=34085 RepID=A0AAP3AP28_RIEAN|nr:hypothetical protein [Riemerella anatipestifer]MBT0573693.1 hypothetical protein [Riemerella anatipestifer]MCQ4155106.1 hypothetical protein [Riemerella anatipestifer]MCQ4181078.1 hypothetical protein [Riemerella anatipestifer]MCU7542952.1 hypothetical protein [Riemerella anatipestifer]MCU7568669.1 hypothetical protein [Riemerella anatipestifer]